MKKIVLMFLIGITILLSNVHEVYAINTITVYDWEVESFYSTYYALTYWAYVPAGTSSVSITIPDTQYLTLSLGGQVSKVAMVVYDGTEEDPFLSLTFSEIFNIDDDADFKPDTIYFDLTSKWVHTSTYNSTFTEDVLGFNYIIITILINSYPFPSGYLDTYFLDNAPIVFYSDTAYQVRYFYITNGRFVPYDSTVANDGLQLP